jgi:hypothetical protein
VERWWNDTDRRTEVWSVGGMELTGETQALAIATLSSANLIWTGLASNLGLRGYRLEADCLNQGTAKTYVVPRSEHTSYGLYKPVS